MTSSARLNHWARLWAPPARSHNGAVMAHNSLMPGLFGGVRPYMLSTKHATRQHPYSVSAPALAQRAPSIKTLSDIRELKDLRIESPELSSLELRDVKGLSYVSRRRLDSADFDPEEVDDDGLPLVYNEEKIAQFWKNRPGELASRWGRFAAVSAPWLTKMANAFIQGKLEQRQVELARDAVDNLEKLGPTFIKLGQIMSIRPDVLPPGVMRELAKLQDKIEPFDTQEARRMVKRELGQPVEQLFSEFSAKPIAAASLAQVYRARLRSTGQEVAVKVQRPGALSTISKDLYVMRRAVGVYEQLVKRFTAQTTDYQELLSTFAEGLYTEMDFRNEALNASRMQQLLNESEFSTTNIVIPKVFLEYTTRRVLVMEWVSGVKLTTLPAEEVRSLAKVGQEAFLTQLLEIGFFHGDPHPGNLLKVTEGPNAGKLALLDFGLVAEIPAHDREAMVSATIHLANRDWDALITDFIQLGFLPPNADRGLIIPVMDRVLSPYLRGGGARAFNFSALSQDLLAATLEIPFSVPPYMSLLARSVATLEGIALVGDPNYQMVAQAYPFVVRKVLRNDSSSAGLLLRDIVYDADGNLKPTRMSALLNAALGYVAEKVGGFVDFDAVPDEGASMEEIFSFLLSPEARDLRPLLVAQLATGLDLYLRDRARRLYTSLPSLAPRLPFIGALPTPPLPPVYVPGLGLMAVDRLLDRLAPALNREEEVQLRSLVELTANLLGVPSADLEAPRPDRVLQLLASPSEQMRELQQALATLSGSSANTQAVRDMAAQVVDELADRQAQRAGVPIDRLLPIFPVLRRLLLASAGPSDQGPTSGNQARVRQQSGSVRAASRSRSSGAAAGAAAVGAHSLAPAAPAVDVEIVMPAPRQSSSSSQQQRSSSSMAMRQLGAAIAIAEK